MGVSSTLHSYQSATRRGGSPGFGEDTSVWMIAPAFDRLEARYQVPYHWGTFEHVSGRLTLSTGKSLLPQYSKRSDVRIPEPGHVLEHAPL